MTLDPVTRTLSLTLIASVIIVAPKLVPRPCEWMFLFCMALVFMKSFTWLVCLVVSLFMPHEKAMQTRMLKAILERNLCSQGIVPANLTLHFQQSDFDKYAFCVQFYNIFKVKYLFWFGKILYLCCALI